MSPINQPNHQISRFILSLRRYLQQHRVIPQALCFHEVNAEPFAAGFTFGSVKAMKSGQCRISTPWLSANRLRAMVLPLQIVRVGLQFVHINCVLQQSAVGGRSGRTPTQRRALDRLRHGQQGAHYRRGRTSCPPMDDTLMIIPALRALTCGRQAGMV